MGVNATTGDVITEPVSPITVQTATIASGQSVSGTIDFGTASAVEIFFPAAWDAAVITFRNSPDGITFDDLYKQDGTTEYSLPVTAGRSVLLTLTDFAGIRYLQIRSGTSASPVTQTASRTFQINQRAV